MLKKVSALLIVACLMAGCDKQRQGLTGCSTQTCTLSFAMIGVQFTDKNGNAVVVQNLTSINQRTKESMLPGTQQGITQTGYYYIADDSMRSKLSTAGDDVLVTATNPATGQTKSVTFKISGGCNCHVDKISGPQTIVFD